MSNKEYKFFEELWGFRVGQRVASEPFRGSRFEGTINQIREDGFAQCLWDDTESNGIGRGLLTWDDLATLEQLEE